MQSRLRRRRAFDVNVRVTLISGMKSAGRNPRAERGKAPGGPRCPGPPCRAALSDPSWAAHGAVQDKRLVTALGLSAIPETT